MKFERLLLGAMQVNCYIVWNPEIGNAYVIDPGDDPETVYGRLQDLKINCSAILLTHGHFDHISGVERLKELTGAKVYAGEAEAALLADADLNVSKRIRRPVTVIPDRFINDGEEITNFGMTFKTIATPGHTRGSVCFYFEKEGVLFSGDTLFKSGMGRTDLPTGSEGELYASIIHRLLTLPGDTVCCPGHGEATNIASESKYFRI